MKRSKFREATFQILWNQLVAHSEQEALVPLLAKELKITRKLCYQAWERAHKIIAKKKELVKVIEKALTGYLIDELGKIESTVLYLGLYEILYDPDTPNPVAIAEAIRLQKKFGKIEALSLINACLDKVAKDASN